MLLPLFLLLCILNLLAEYQDHTPLIYATKPLLLSILSLYFFTASKEVAQPFRWWILAGLIFSIAGDTFLMFVENSTAYPHFFLLGLGSFLITHLCYLLGFIGLANQPGWLQQRPWLLLLFLAYLIGNSIFLWPDLPPALKIPVVVYSAAIIAMTAAAINLRGLISSSAFGLLICGVLLFVSSDSLIALNKFKSSQLIIPQVRLLIMTTYLLGQYLIVKGCLKTFHPSSIHV